MATFVALLRAVNVGGTGKLPMSELKAMCEELGFGSVCTYIASGNVVFTSRKSEAAIKAALEKRLEAFAGKPLGVMVRSAEEMARVAAENPFPKAAPNRTVAIFLERAPPKDTLAGVRGQKDEEIRLGRREIYVRALWRRHGAIETRHSRGQDRHRAQPQHGRDAGQDGRGTLIKQLCACPPAIATARIAFER
jgi:uncharacterized protein (DUF1697 family)